MGKRLHRKKSAGIHHCGLRSASKEKLSAVNCSLCSLFSTYSLHMVKKQGRVQRKVGVSSGWSAEPVPELPRSLSLNP